MSALTGIHNENRLYGHDYLAEIFAGDIQATLERWRKEAEGTSARTPYANSAPLRQSTCASATNSRTSYAPAGASFE